jgi:hypothetical protein
VTVFSDFRGARAVESRAFPPRFSAHDSRLALRFAPADLRPRVRAIHARDPQRPRDGARVRRRCREALRAQARPAHARGGLQHGSAIEAVAKGEVEAAVSARGADPENPLETELKFTPVAWDALALVVFPGNPVRSIGVEQLHDVLAGKIKDWNELGGKPGAINLYAVAGPFDGVEFALRRLVLGNGRAGTAAQRWYVNTVQLEAAVAIDPMGLGVSILSDVAANNELRVLAIDNVAPSSRDDRRAASTRSRRRSTR